MKYTKLSYAISYLNAGLSIVPANKAKRPTVASWKELQSKPMSAAEAAQCVSEDAYVCVITGAVSGHLECIDVDCKYDLTGVLWQSYSEALQALPNGLFDRLVIQATQNKGYHILYRCATIGGNEKIATRPATAEELEAKNKEVAEWNAANPTLKPKAPVTSSPKALIETRGEGGYILVYPSEGYKFIQGNPLKVETITPEEREMLFECARVFHEAAPMPQAAAHVQSTAYTPTSTQSTANDIRPGDDFNSQHSALDVMQGAYERGKGTDKQGRAGVRICNSPNGEPNGFYYPNENKVFVFSPNYGVPTEKALTAFDVYTHLQHGGNYSSAATALAKQGFGSKRSTQAKPKAERPARAEATATTDGGGLESNPYFRLLGFDKTESGVQAFFFYRKGSNTLLRLTASAMSKNNLMTLAPLQWWESSFEGKKGIDVDAAINWLIQTSQAKGHFRTKNVRGRGAWIDGSAVVIHTGDKLIVNGRETALEAHTSKYIYESGEELGIGTNNPLTTEESRRFLDLCQIPSWQRGVNGMLLAGWCVIAPVCGALPWRPHLWLCGESSTGKSTVFREIVKRMAGEAAIRVQGNTSESGLRQTLQFDAIPVVFDEAEGEDKASQDRMASVLTLMRSASADDSGKIIKGGQDGQAKAYDIRSCFAFASIVFQASQQADLRRITVLETKKIKDAAKVDELKKRLGEGCAALTDEYVQRFQARTVKLLPTILANSKIFGQAVAQVVGQNWAGDQIGILLAGAYSLHHDGIVTYNEAHGIVRSQDWSEEKGLEQQTDQARLVAKLAEQTVRIGIGLERTVGELILIAAQEPAYYSSELSGVTANDALKRLGIKVETYADGSREVLFSNTADWIKKVLASTAWGSNHSKVIARIDGAKQCPPSRFAATQSRAVAIPIDIFKD